MLKLMAVKFLYCKLSDLTFVMYAVYVFYIEKVCWWNRMLDRCSQICPVGVGYITSTVTLWVLEGDKENLVPGGFNRAALSLWDINTETWPSRLGIIWEADDLVL
jgi:hypothetical protein